MQDSYERHFGLWSPEQQADLANTSVAVGGLGGIGSAQSLMLAKAGIGRIRVADRDAYEIENVVEQAFATWDAQGLDKTRVARKEMLRHQKGLCVERWTGDLAIQKNADQLVEGVDILFAGVDNAPARIALGRAATKIGIPMVVSANVGWTVIHTVYSPDDGGYANAWTYLDGVVRDEMGYPDLGDAHTRRRVDRDWRIWVLVLSGFRGEAAQQYLASGQEYCWYAAAPAFHAASLGVNDGLKVLLGLPGVIRYPKIWVFDLLRNRILTHRECVRRHRRVAAIWGRGEQAVMDVVATFEAES